MDLSSKTLSFTRTHDIYVFFRQTVKAHLNKCVQEYWALKDPVVKASFKEMLKSSVDHIKDEVNNFAEKNDFFKTNRQKMGK